MIRYDIPALALGAAFSGTIAHATEPLNIPCPTPGQTCKIIVLTSEEESILTGKNGVLDTAAQSRALDLGPFVVYVRQKIAQAPEGTVTKLPDQAPKADAAPAKP
jgi:hypothetical protein